VPVGGTHNAHAENRPRARETAYRSTPLAPVGDPPLTYRTTDLELPTAPFGPTPLRTLRNEVAAREQSLVADSGQLPPAANSGSKQRSLPSRCDDRVAQPLKRVEAQQQMEAVTDKWGIQINLIEIVAIAPPPKILGPSPARSGRTRRSGRRSGSRRVSSRQRSTSPRARRRRPSALRKPRRRFCESRAAGRPRSSRPKAVRRPSAPCTPPSRRVIQPTLVAILQLDALAMFADSDNAKIVVPFESAGLLGAAQTLRSVLAAVPGDGDQLEAAVRSNGRRRASPLW
jgi:hypothetical protein